LPAPAQSTMSAAKLEALKKELVAEIDKQQAFSAQMVDMIFSFGELGFQEEETSKYLTGILKQNGFTIEYGISKRLPPGWPGGVRASRSLPWAVTSTAFRKPPRSPGSPTMIRSSRGRPGTEKGTTRGSRSM
jgi:hypothetical protein